MNQLKISLLFGRVIFFFSSKRRHTRYWRDWSSDVCSSDLELTVSSMPSASSASSIESFVRAPRLLAVKVRDEKAGSLAVNAVFSARQEAVRDRKSVV